LQNIVSFAKETYNFKGPKNRSHPIVTRVGTGVAVDMEKRGKGRDNCREKVKDSDEGERYT